jgi:hypothetical protein
MSDPRPALLELLCLAAFHDPSAPIPGRVARLAESIDWQEALEGARFHLLEPAVWRLVSSDPQVPEDVRDRLRKAALAGSARNLVLTSALKRLLTVFDEAEVPVVVLKGPVLATEAYGDLSRRCFTDIDLLVKREETTKAFTVLEAAGFSSFYPLNDDWKTRYVRRFYEMTFRDHLGVSIDLHWSLIDSQFSFCPPEAETWKDTRQVDVCGTAVSTLSADMTARYLCLHVAKHHWDRLGWLADVAHWMTHGPAMNWEPLARDEKSGRYVMITLGLIEKLSGRSIPAEVSERIARDGIVQEQIASVQSRLLQAASPAVTRSAHWRTEFARAMPSTFDRWRSFYSTLFRPSILEWKAVPLPAALSPLYAVIRPCRLLWKRLKGIGAEPG